MTIPTLTTLPVAPARTDPPATFVTRADAFLAAIVTFQGEMNTSIGAMNTDIAGVNADATAAAASAAAASTSETNAATSETNAAASAVTASDGATTVQDAVDDLQTLYLGAKASNPTLDNEGNPLVEGAMYFNTVVNLMKVYVTGSWVDAGSSVNGTLNRFNTVATSGQTTFTTNYDIGFVDVYLNGVKLVPDTDFTASNGTSIVLTTGATLNDNVEIIAFGSFQVADQLQISNNLSDVASASASIVNLGISATAAELNTLDGITASTSELNILDGVTATAEQINKLDLLTRGSLIYGNASGEAVELVKGSVDQILTSDGTDISWQDLAAGGGFTNIQVFTSSGTWNIPSGITKCKVTVLGGGGAGSGGGTNYYGYGGSAGGAAIKIYDLVNSTASVVVGSGGIRSASQNGAGGAGGFSSFTNNSVTITGTGGGGGPIPSNSSVYSSNGGTGSGGDINIEGGWGSANGGTGYSGNYIYGGMGGSSIFGAGSASRIGSSSLDRQNANYGGGGGGGPQNGASGYHYAGNGGNGIVIIEY